MANMLTSDILTSAFLSFLATFNCCYLLVGKIFMVVLSFASIVQDSGKEKEEKYFLDLKMIWKRIEKTALLILFSISTKIIEFN